MIALQKQANTHNPNEGTWGDCHRTAYAMVLGLPRDEVPHVFDRGASADEGNRAMAAWLDERGLVEVTFPNTAENPETLLLAWSSFSPKVPFILGGMSKFDVNHSVVVMNGEIFDPSTKDSGIVGPCDDGYYWITFIMPKARISAVLK